MALGLSNRYDPLFIDSLDEYRNTVKALDNELIELKQRFGDNIPGVELSAFLEKLANFNARRDFTLTEFLQAHTKITLCTNAIERFTEKLPYFKLTYFLYGTAFGAFLFWLGIRL